jgi:uncharacterized OB-fold protein
MMGESQLLKPELYAPAQSSQPGDAVTLKGGRCTCGYTFFPMQHYGCEMCGRFGADLQPTALPGRGQLVASVTVHIHASKDRVTPFTIGTIKLDAGPVVRALLSGPLDGLAPGRPMVATLVPVAPAEPGKTTLDLRFTPATSDLA